MTLQAEVARFEALAFARVVIRFAVVGPVDDLHAVDPRGEVGAVGDEHRGEPLAVVRDHAARRDSFEDRSRAVVVGLSPVAVFEAALNYATKTLTDTEIGRIFGASKDELEGIIEDEHTHHVRGAQVFDDADGGQAGEFHFAAFHGR